MPIISVEIMSIIEERERCDIIISTLIIDIFYYLNHTLLLLHPVIKHLSIYLIITM